MAKTLKKRNMPDSTLRLHRVLKREIAILLGRVARLETAVAWLAGRRS